MKFAFCFLLCACAVSGQGQSFFDDFSRGTDPGPLTPWSLQSGTWAVTGGALKGGVNSGASYGYAYVGGAWTNYSVQARVRFSNTIAYGGGIGGRLNPAFGGHYAAYICPDGSAAGGNTLQLYKFQDWQSIEFTNSTDQPMAIVNLPSVGTNWHWLKLAFQASQISVYFDSNLVATATDTESSFFGSGGITAEMFTDDRSYNMFVDDVLVTPLPSVLMAADDAYFTTQGTGLTLASPGVMANDTIGQGPSLAASVVSGPAKGTLTWNSNGGFTYTPSGSFTGVDSFTYKASDGSSTSAPATVAIDVAPAGALFFDDFSRTGSGDPFGPWIIGIGEWVVAGGTLQGNATIANNYSDAYVPRLVQDFSVQARIRLQANAWAGGLSGRVNPVTGARYVVNIYPDHSPLGPVNAMRLIKFSAWEAWSFTPMALVNLPSVGTNYHTLKINFQGNQITVFYDGTQVINMADNLFDGAPAYANGFFGAHMYMDAASVATFDDYTVTPLPSFNHPPVLPAQTNRTIAALTTLIVTNTAADTDLPTNTLSYSLLTAPAGATIDTNGVITWIPAQAQDLSTNLFTTVVTDFNPGSTNNAHLSATNNFTVLVNSRPNVILDSTSLVQEGCSPPNNAIDPGENVVVSVSLRNIGPGATTNLTVSLLATNGVVVTGNAQQYGQLLPNGAALAEPFSFVMTASCGSTVNAIFQLQDGPANLGNITLPLILGQNSVIVTQGFDSVSTPSLPQAWTSSATGAESPWVTQSSAGSTPPNCAFVPDAPNVGSSDLVSPSFALPNGPLQLTFANSYDLETNTSVEAYDGGVLEIKIGSGAFTDILAAGGAFVANGYTHTISTNFSNPLGGRRAWSGTSVGGFVTTVVNLPASASGQNVQFRWRCGTDNSNGRTGWRIDAVGITGRVCCANTAPVLAARQDQTVAELTTLTVTNSATDTSTSTSNLSYTLVNPPAGAVIDSAGIISWTPTEAQGPGVYSLKTIVSDNSLPPLTATNSFHVTVLEVNTAPVLPIQPNFTVNELAPLVVTNQASDSDLPANSFSYTLVNPPAGMSINGNGVITWVPAESQGPSTNVITTVVTDNGVPPLSTTNTFIVVVAEVNGAPVLSAQIDRTIAELTTLRVTNTASDPDLPPNNLSYMLLEAPVNATINPQGVIEWTPGESEGPGTNLITTVVTDDGIPPLSATNTFLVVVTEVNSAPVLPFVPDQTIAELTALIVTNTATDSDVPANALTYTLLDPPAGATISTNGIIQWTPGEDEGPSTNTITTIVTDDGIPPLSATNSFQVVVLEVNSPPTLPFQSDRTIIAFETLMVTNAATDPDIPTNQLAYTFLSAPNNAVIDTNGIITWTPTISEVPGTNVFSTIVTDDGIPPLSATNSFVVIVKEIHNGPTLPPLPDLRVDANALLIVTNTAIDADVPVWPLNYQLLQGPTGAGIDANGLLSWTPSSNQAPSTNIIRTVVIDEPAPGDGPPISSTNVFTIFVDRLPAEAPNIQSISVSNGDAVLQWSSVPGYLYHLQFSDDLAQTSWLDSGLEIMAAEFSSSATNSVGDLPQRFYRVLLLP